MKKRQSLMVIVLAFALIGTSIYGVKMHNDSRSYKTYLENQYQRNLYDLVGNVNDLEVSLSKAIITGSDKQSSILFGDIWREASAAHEKLNSLPLVSSGTSNTVKFLSQVSDFSYAMLKSNTNGKKLSKEQYVDLEKLKDYCGYINLQLKEFVSNVGAKGISFENLIQNGSNYLENTKNEVNVAFQNLSDQIQQYPTLIYDGPFSENALNIKPKVLGEKEISIDEANKLVERIFGKDKIESIKQYSSKIGEKIPAYAFSVKLKGRNAANINIDISKNGGHILYLLDSRNINVPKISIKEATNIGTKFLKSINYPNMMPLYTLKYDNVVMINYVSVNNKTLIYPDQIKLKIALDNGDITGIESQSYLTAHHNRDIPKVNISVNQAKSKVNKRLKIRNIRLTLIPMEASKEVLCYEFYCDYNGEKYFVYIDAKNGSEERILKVINTSNGELTM